jgi:alpha-L-rhamnosidase
MYNLHMPVSNKNSYTTCLFACRWMMLFLFSTIFAKEPAAPGGLTIEVARNDTALIVVSDPFPEFGWIMNDPDKNEYQSAFQILVASSRKNLDKNKGDMWDSGKVKDPRSGSISYSQKGKALESGRMYFWKVRLWDKDGKVSPYSAAARFITALKESDWIAKPIWDASNPLNKDVADFAYFRKKISPFRKKIKYAIAFVTSRDARIQKSPAYKFYLNNRLLGIGPFQGYKDRVTYQGYDLTEYLNINSANILSAICESSVKEKDFLLQLYIRFENSDTTFGTDGTWKSYNAQSIYNPQGSKTSNAYHYIDPFENIDARKIPSGWMDAGYDDSAWPRARERHTFYEKLAAAAKPALQIEEIHPKTIKYLGQGAYDITFGSGYFGALKLTFNHALAGDTIAIRGERDIYPWTVTDWQKWIISQPAQTIEEVGYVWTDSLQIRGYDGRDTLDASNITFVTIRNPFDDNASHFNSSSALLNGIYDFCKRSVKHLNVDFFWDTPQNERLAYEGGALIQQMTSYSMDNDYALPRFATEYQYYEPTWPQEYRMQSVLMGWQDFLYTGDIESIKENWDILKEKRYPVYSKSHFLVENIAAAALDWPPPYMDGYNYEDGDPDNIFIDNVLNAWNYYAHDHLARMAGLLDSVYLQQGFNIEQQYFSSVARAIKENYNKVFYSKDKARYLDGLNSAHAAMHSSFMAVALDLVPEKFKDNLARYLAGRAMDCGVFGAQFYLLALYELNQGDRALELITSKEKNSWYHVMHELKATIATEAWDPSGKPDMSKSHAWGSAAGNIIQRGLMGINPLEPGFKKISIKPQTGNLHYARMDLPTIKGKITVNVSKSADSYTIEINIPANASAKVYVDKMGSSSAEVEVDGKIENGMMDKDNAFIVFDNIGSGLHTFTRRF